MLAVVARHRRDHVTTGGAAAAESRRRQQGLRCEARKRALRRVASGGALSTRSVSGSARREGRVLSTRSCNCSAA